MKLFRPLLMMGFVAIGLAVFSLLLVPGWHQDPLSLVGLLIVLGLGVLAVYTDLKRSWQELKDSHSQDKREPPV